MKRGVFIFWSIFIATAIFRIWQSFGIEPPDIGDCVKQNVQGVGIIENEPERKENGQVFVVSVLDLSVVSTSKYCNTEFLIRLKTKLYPRFSFGDKVSFKGKLLQPTNFDSGSGRIFDYKNYLAKDDIYFEMKSAVVSLTKIVQQNNSSWFGIQSFFSKLSSQLFSLKRNFVNNLKKTLGEPHSALASGLVVGEKSALGNDLLDDFRKVGLIHIVVLSGYNITIVADAMRRLLSFLPRVWGISVGGIGIALFGILVGGGATVVRSCLMASIALFADIIRRDYSVIHALMFAGLLMLVQNPMILLHDPSFQLSFLATLGLIILAGPIEKRLTFITERFGIRGIVASTIATQIFVSPYILYMMGQISIIGMLVNILVLPFIPVTMLFVFITGIVGMFWLPLAQVFGWASHLLLSYELFMVNNFARFPFASLQVEAFSFWWVVGFYVVFAGVYLRRKIFTRFKLFRSRSDSNTLLLLFKEFQKLPKNVLIDNPDDKILTNFNTVVVSQLLNTKFKSIHFSRRTFKHLAEKDMEGKNLLEMMVIIFKNPDIILKGKNNRLLITKFFPDNEGEPHVIVFESVNDEIIIITSFVTDKKYLKNFEILWRTGTSFS
ncbi:MAG: ComEC/Rec2 family competence protein [Candidatus Paceibacterota bacterium]